MNNKTELQINLAEAAYLFARLDATEQRIIIELMKSLIAKK